MDKKFRKNKKVTPERKQEIIEYAQKYGVTKALKDKFGVWPETVRYWIDADLREKLSTKGRERHKTRKHDKEYKEKCLLYRQHRRETGEGKAKWLEWWNNLSEEEKEEKKKYVKQHRLDNIEHYKERSKKKYQKEKEDGVYRRKYKEDPVVRMKSNIREHVRQALKYSNVSKTHPSITYLGCSIEEFRAYIENKFVEGMSWENHGRGEHCWHLDHIKPLATLKDVTDVELLKEVCHYTNYQPLWEKDNLSKNAKYEG
jgi:transposase-like protein